MTRQGFDRRALLAAPLLLAHPALAQNATRSVTMPQADWHPDRPLRLVLPFAPGGLTDILARAFGPLLTARLGQPAVVENRAGGGGNIAAEAVARATPDGTTLMVVTQGVIALNGSLYARLPYDPVADFAVLGMLGRQPNLLVASPRILPTGGLAELLALARQKPGGLSYGSNGVGSFTHLSMELLASRAGVPMTHVPYRGSAPMLTDLVSGTLDCAFDALGTSAPQVRAGALRAVAVSSLARSPFLPDVPAVSETVAGFDANPWYGVFAQSAAPPPALAALATAVQSALADPAWAAVLAERQVDRFPGDPATLTAAIATERALWAGIIRATGAKAE